MLDAIAKEVWLDALRSREFPKGESCLKQFDGYTFKGKAKHQYCCLGVAQEIFPALKQCNDGRELLSNASIKLLGLTEDQQGTLAHLNDNSLTFGPVIKYIKEKL